MPARIVLTSVSALMLISAAIATPTTPVRPNITDLTAFYLVKSNDTLQVLDQEPSFHTLVLAKGRYNTSSHATGWDYCQIQTDDASHDAYYYGGYLEGWLGSASMANTNWNNSVNANVSTWIDQHLGFMEAEAHNKEFSDPFWSQIGKLLRQMQGIADGYSAKTGVGITLKDVFLQNFGNEIGDVETALQVQAGVEATRSNLDIANSMHCSALIKVTHDDIFVAHDTWSGFSGLGIRVYKVYSFGRITVAMDSFPGIIASGTDWYITSNELSILETTNIVFNTTLYKAVVPKTVSEFLRVMTANYLATTGDQWSYYFSSYNSGTYNNQYMVVDYKKFESEGAKIHDGLLWVAEQIPGDVEYADQTNVLRAKGYWASYNINFYERLYVVSGYEEMYQQQGTFWSYTKYARPEIFQRNQSFVHDDASMQKMMRYNNWAADEFSIIPNCTGADAGCASRHTSMLTIASRGDLMTVYNTTAENIAVYGPLYSWVAQGCFGAVDSKIASYKTHLQLRGLVVNGPTNDQQPTFTWGENVNCPASQQPPGSPSTYDFPWVEFYPTSI